MKNLYLIRHGLPDFPGGKRMCLGRTDLPLSAEGFRQAQAAAESLKNEDLEVWSSPLIRAVQTAEALNKPVKIIEGLQELYAGEWDGLNFDEIKLRYAELFAARAADKTLPLPGAEDNVQGLKRFKAALTRACEESAKDLAVFTHAGVMGLFLQSLSGSYEKPSYGQIIHLIYDNGNFILTGGTENA